MEDGKVLRVKFKPGVSPQKRFEGVVRILTDLIEDGMRDEKVRNKAIQIVNSAGVRGHDELGEIRAITRWVQTHAVYRKDPFGVEFFYTARRQIREIEAGTHSGDCDDFVLLGGALLGSMGYPVGALIVDANGDGVFNHVMLVTKTFSPTREFGDGWIPIELIYPEFKLGQSVPVSKVYPLMANAETIRAPIMRKTISGIKGLLGYHPIGAMMGFGAPIKKDHASGHEYRQSNHPKGNPNLADTYIIKKHTHSGIVQAGQAWDPTTRYTYTEDQLKQHPTLDDWRISTSSVRSFNEGEKSLESARSFVDDQGDYYIDTISTKSTPTTGRSTTKRKPRRKSRSRSSYWSRLRRRFRF